MRFWKALIGILLSLLASQALHAQAVLLAHPGPSDNGGSPGTALFFDLQAQSPVVVTGFTAASAAAPGATFDVRVSVRTGTALGGTLSTGPGSSPAGWRLLGTYTATQGSGETSLPINLPDIPVAPGQVVGVAVEFLGISPRYFGTGTPPLQTFGNANLQLRTGEARSVPFTGTGAFFSSRALIGSILYRSGDAVLSTNPGPSDNSGAFGSALLFDIEANTGIVVTGLSTANSAPPGATITLRISTRAGSALGGPVSDGPGSSPDGWTLLGTVTGQQGSSGEVSLPVAIPEIRVGAGQVVGVAIEYIDVRPQYFGVGNPAIQTYGDAHLTVRTGDARSAPFTPTGSFFSSRALIGSLQYRLDDAVLPAHPGPPDNGGLPGSGMFFNLQSTTGAVVNGLTVASGAPPGGSFQIEVFTRNGTALGNTPGSGPATSSAGWTLRGTVLARQGPGEVSLPIDLPDLRVDPGQTLGVGLRFLGTGPRYLGIGSPPQLTYASPGLTLITGQALSIPFSTSSEVFGSRALVGSLSWRPFGERLAAAPGPSNNTGGTGYGMFMDLHAQTDLVVSGFNTASLAPANSDFQMQVYTRVGSTLGGTASSGPTSSGAGWTLHATVTARQAASGQVSLPIAIPDLPMLAGDTLGLALVYVGAAPTYVGTGSAAVSTYSDGNLQLTAGEVKEQPFTPNGNLFVSRRLLGNLFYERGDPIFRNGFE